jgi:ABC-type lipoprotein export system ATPase subunit
MVGSGRPYIECKDLFKIYKREELEVVGLRGLDLEVQAGEFLAIVGSSGSGKSTLLNVLAGLDKPSAGQVYVGERDLLEMSNEDRSAYRRHEVGFLWQATSRNLLPYLTARDNIELPMAIVGAPGAQRKERAMDLLSAVGLAEKADRLPDQLSAGEQQRVGIGVAMANRPPLLLADEPTGELDTRSADLVFQALRTMCEKEKVTIIAVTHYPGVARFVHRVVYIRDGRIAAETVMEPTYRLPGETISQEYLVVDQVGRLQLPRESMEKLGMGRRARVDLQSDGALIKPVGRQE